MVIMTQYDVSAGHAGKALQDDISPVAQGGCRDYQNDKIRTLTKDLNPEAGGTFSISGGKYEHT